MSPSPTPEPIKGDVIIVAVRDNNLGFEWKHPDLGWLDVHTWGGPSVFVGDIIEFRNLDPQTHIVHGFRNEPTGKYDKGELFDTGKLANGKKKRITIDFAPGEYFYDDPGVTYRATSGPLCVFDREDPKKVSDNCEPAN